MRAVFVLDQTDEKFRCHQPTVDISGLKVHLAIPLVGSKRGVVGTLQLSFPDGTLLDREKFGIGEAGDAAIEDHPRK